MALTRVSDSVSYSFDSIAELKTVEGIADQIAYVSGYYAAGDTSLPLYRWNATSTATDDGGSVHQVTGVTTGRWEAIIDGAINVKWFGAKGDNSNEDATYIQAAFDYAESGLVVNNVFIPAGVYIIEDTLIVPEGCEFYGAGCSERSGVAATRLQAKTGLEKDLIRVKAHLFTTYWWYGQIHDMEIFGDSTGTLGHGINFQDGSSNDVTPQDTTLLYNLVIRYIPQNGINLPRGAIPLHIRDVKFKTVGNYGISFTGISITVATVHFDNISGDSCVNGLIYLKDCDASSNLLFTSIKAEESTEGQEYILIFDNCDRASVVVDSIHSVSGVPDGGFFEAPKDMIRITGAGCPSIVWAGAAARIRSTDTLISTSYVLNDTITGKTFHSSVRQGQYNTLPVSRESFTGFNLANNAGRTASISLDAHESVAAGEPILGAVCQDQEELMMGEAYSLADTAVLRFENFTGTTVTTANNYIRFIRVPQHFFKAQASKTFDPPSALDGASQSTTVTVPCALGDFVMYTHAITQKSWIVTSYVSAANTVTVHWHNETGTPSDIGSATLTAYVLKESAFKYINSVAYDPASLADDAREVTTITVPGAALGDFVMATFSLDLQGIKMWAYVSAADTVKVVLQNLTGGVLDLAAGTLKVGIIDTDQ